MLVREALAQATFQLENQGVESPRLDAELLLAHVLGVNRAALFARPERRLTLKELTRYRDLVARRAAREPLAYLLGHREFFGLDFVVGPDVLIPRPETELLVEHALRLARARPGPVRIADVGTGSGAIAVALAVHLPEAIVFALDHSPAALAIAARNAQSHGVGDRVHFCCGDLLAPLLETVDLIVANLPYVTTGEWEALPPEIRDHEPRSALDGGPDGLTFIRRLLETALPHLQPDGAILVEIGAGQGQMVLSLAVQHFPQAHVELYQDYAGWDRIVMIEMRGSQGASGS